MKENDYPISETPALEEKHLEESEKEESIVLEKDENEENIVNVEPVEEVSVEITNENEPIDLQDLEFLYENFPDSIFVLNTRPLIDWLISRVTHGYKYRQKWCRPFSKEKCLSWISNRESDFYLNFYKK